MAEKRLTNQEMKARLAKEELRRLIADKPFRSWALRFFEKAGIFRETYSRADPGHSSYLEGKRALGLEVLMEMLAADASAAQLIFPGPAMMAALAGKPQGEDDAPRDEYPDRPADDEFER